MKMFLLNEFTQSRFLCVFMKGGSVNLESVQSRVFSLHRNTFNVHQVYVHGCGNNWQKPGKPRYDGWGQAGRYFWKLPMLLCPCEQELPSPDSLEPAVPMCLGVLMSWLGLQGFDSWGLITPDVQSSVTESSDVLSKQEFGSSSVCFLMDLCVKSIDLNNKPSSQMCFYCKEHPLY